MAEDESAVPTYEIRKQAHFDRELSLLVPDIERAVEIGNGIRFILRHFPEAGQPAGINTPVPVYTYFIRGTTSNPPLIVFYAFGAGRVLIMGIEQTIDQDA